MTPTWMQRLRQFCSSSLTCRSAPSRKARVNLRLEALETRLTPADVGVNDFRISDMGPDGNTSYNAADAVVAYNSIDNEYLVVWSADHLGTTVDNEFEIFGQRFNAATAAPINARFRISDMGPDGDADYDAFDPAVTYNPVTNEYLVVWEADDNNGGMVDNEFEIFGQRINAATGIQVGSNDFRICTMGPNGDSNFGAFNPAVTYNSVNNEYLVVWSGEDNGGALVDGEFEIFGQRLDATGAQVGTNDFRISDMGPDGDDAFDALDPAVAYNSANNEYLVVWAGDDDTGTLVDGEREIFGQRLNGVDGTAAGSNDIRLTSMGTDGDTAFGAFAPAVAYNSVNNQYLVVWAGDDNSGGLVDGELEIFGQRLTGAGASAGANDFRISDMGPNGDTNFDASNPAVVYNSASNEYLVVWQGEDDTGTLVVNEHEIFGQRIEAVTGAQVGINDFRISDMGPDGDTNFGASNPAVAFNSGSNEFLIAWHGDDNTGTLVDNEFEIFGQRFTSVEPPPAAPPVPLPPPSVFGVPFRRKGRSRVWVFDATTGAFRATLTPFRSFGGRLRVEHRDVNGDGSIDLIVRAVINGKRKHKVYDAVTLASLPSVLA